MSFWTIGMIGSFGLKAGIFVGFFVMVLGFSYRRLYFGRQVIVSMRRTLLSMMALFLG
jgi:hypothetical protein